MNIIKQAMENFSLSEQDAVHLAQNHSKILANAVKSPALTSVSLNFIDNPVIPSNWSNILSGPLKPSEALKNKVQLYFSRMCFIVNTPEFIKLFNENLHLLRPAQNNPSNFNEFKDYLSQKLNQDYDAVVNISTFRNVIGANAYGLRHNGLNIYLDEDQVLSGTSYNNQGLLLHELMHTAGYEHIGNNDGFNDVPEYVQLLLMPGALNRKKFPTLTDLIKLMSRMQTLVPNSGDNKDIISHYFDS
ncbi:hypothetical protein [Photobacterium sp. J15]|uniref:hypothetical protein n=1 Tax=Photobacterium sp. J15 TaxID=265901 RepID=UPI0007E344EC|nr:hypothetical protein [Photobacterium sp. J15]